MKILIVMPNWIGDIVMSLPALEKIKEIFADEDLFVLIRKDFYPLIEENLKIIDVKPIFYHKKNLSNTISLIKKIKNFKFQKAFIFPRSYRMFLIVLFAGIKEIYGYGNDFLKKNIMKISVERNKEILSFHRVFYYLQLPKKLKNFEKISPPTLFIPEKYELWANRLINNLGIKDKILIGINPGATYGEAKCWPADYFIELIKLLKKEINCAIFLIGGKDNIEKCEYIEEKTNVLNFAGKLSIIESAALIKKMNVFITNDTGPMHIADALEVKVVAIFGPTDIKETPPFRKNGAILYKNLPCSPCKQRKCPYGHNDCMKMIKPTEVYQAVVELIPNKAAPIAPQN